MVKVLFITPYFAPAFPYGGTVEMLYLLTKKLVEKGISVDVVTTDVYNSKKGLNVFDGQLKNIEGVNVYYFKTISNHLSWRFKGFISPGMNTFLKEKFNSYDLIHLNEYYSYQTYIASRILYGKGINLFFQPNGSFLPLKTRGMVVAKKIFDFFVWPKLKKIVNRFVAVSPYEVNQFIEKGIDRSKIILIPNSINFKKRVITKKNYFYKKYGILKTSKVVLFLGRLDPVKGLDRLILEFKKLNNYRNVFLVIAGEKSHYQLYLERLIAKEKIRNIIFIGFLNQEEKAQAMSNCDLFVYPSYDDVFGISVLEALFFKKPVLISNKVGISSWVSKINNYYIFSDKNEISRKISKIIFNRKNFIEKKIYEEIIQKNFSLDRNAELLKKSYLENL